MEFVLSTSKSFSFLLLIFLVVYCSIDYRSDAQPLLPLEEVKTLQTISKKLHNKYWNNISRSSCRDSEFNRNFTFDGKTRSNVTCNCTFNSSTVCYVTNIQLKRLNLTGVFPYEFGDLSHLQEIDLTLNYIYGPIPTSLARLPHLVILTLLGNRVSGNIPEEIGEIATLEELVLEDNQLSGPLPEKLGNLGRLRRLVLSANNFTGSIPETFGKLTNLTAFGIDGSSLSGKIPDFIGNWTKITRLDLQGTSMEGPIPSTISQLTKLEQLRITDLSGSSMDFPDLKDMKNLQILELRNCLITGQIPEHIGNFTKMKQLDLSFNKLTGQIPSTAINYLFLTNNSLSGDVPAWILSSKQHLFVDVSYNNFNGSNLKDCPQSDANFNLVSSYASLGSNSTGWCLKDLPCPGTPQYHSLFINCGGGMVNFEGNEYEEDSNPGGSSKFYASGTKWAYSSTGVFMDNSDAKYITTNTLSLNITGADYYKTARLAPMSLKYYGLCLRKGNYKVQLHFAELLYTDDQTYSSLGKRIFDISIQGNKVLKDFNIMEEAKGVGKGITKTFPSVDVDNNTLEIHLYWSGKGTTFIPNRGVYGPLISAITVTPNFDVGTALSVGPIVGIVAASCVVLVLILLVLQRKGFLGGKKLEDNELRGLDLQTGSFTLRQLKAATNNFDPKNKIGEGGFGPVYKGVLSDGAIIAIKQLSSKSKQGNREFVNEIGMISALQHPNLVRLYGCCIEGNQLLLVYEYMENNSLAHSLFGLGGLNLDWTTRNNICLGIARGLAYMHEESRLKIVHRDIKATNVLLDKDLNAKISDFGLAKLDEGENSHISTRIAGTIGYMAPEYAMRGYLTDKADVYSFGVVMLEIVSGKSNNTNYRAKEEIVCLLDMAYVLREQGDLLDLMDPSLGSNYDKEEAMRMLNLALSCTFSSPFLRPSMSSIVSMLEGKSAIQEITIQRSSTNQITRFKDFEELSSQDSSQTHVSTFSLR